MSYIKAKKYVIRPSKKDIVLELIEKTFRGSKYQTAISRVLNDKAMTWKRWMYYFDYNLLEDILMEEDCVEVTDFTETEDIGI